VRNVPQTVVNVVALAIGLVGLYNAYIWQFEQNAL
jgi:hypothetical protein